MGRRDIGRRTSRRPEVSGHATSCSLSPRCAPHRFLGHRRAEAVSTSGFRANGSDMFEV